MIDAPINCGDRWVNSTQQLLEQRIQRWSELETMRETLQSR